MNISVIARRPFYDKFFIKPSMPGFLRLALIDSLSFDKNSHLGGSINNFRCHNFLKLKSNSGLKDILKELADIHKQGNHITEMLSLSDLIQIGGAASIQYCGGPFIDVR